MWYTSFVKRNKIFKVVVALTMQSYAGQRKLAGIFRFLSGKYLWDMTLLRSAQELTTDLIGRTKHETDGYIISVHESAEIRTALVKARKPIVFLDDIDLPSISKNDNASFLKTDQQAIGAAAASYFLGQARFATFAFVYPIGKPHWSRGRAEGFISALARRKLTASVYTSEGAASDADDLANWISALPKPAAIFAAFDDRAVDVINACHTCGIKIPKDVMILGAGDDALICNSCRPTLSSVKIQFEEHGFMAARELQAKMLLPISNRKILNTAEDFFITQRQTTTSKIATAAIVHDGLAFISASATSGITVPDVVRHLNVSRRLADLRFRQATGKSILQTIIETRITEAKKMLRSTSLPVSNIARHCGFSSANYFKNVFVRTVGLPPRSWRNSQRTEAKPTHSTE